MATDIPGPAQYETTRSLRAQAEELTMNALQACLSNPTPEEKGITVGFSTVYETLHKVFNFQSIDEACVIFPGSDTQQVVDLIHVESSPVLMGEYGGHSVYEDTVLFAWAEPNGGDISLVKWSLVHMDNEALFRGGRIQFLKVQTGEGKGDEDDFDITFHSKEISENFFSDDLALGKYGPFITWETEYEIATIHNSDQNIDVLSESWGARSKDAMGRQEIEAAMALMNEVVELLMPEQSIEASRIFMDRRVLAFMLDHSS